MQQFTRHQYLATSRGAKQWCVHLDPGWNSLSIQALSQRLGGDRIQDHHQGLPRSVGHDRGRLTSALSDARHR
jgi:hypothetical protein